jgi:DNA-directed RNA polymerase specialized sigma24 family protein
MSHIVFIQGEPDEGPSAKCLVGRIAELQCYLRRKGFRDDVIERAIDRVIQAALPYLEPSRTAPHLRNRDSWLFGSALKAAKQVASREPACSFIDPALLNSAESPEEDEDRAAAVWLALDQLTEPQREAVYWCIMRGMSLITASRQMGCSPTNVLHHRDRGLDRLRSLLSSRNHAENPPVR